MFDVNDDVYFYIGFVVVSLHVFYPLLSNIMHPKVMELKEIPNRTLLKYIQYVNQN